MLKFDWSNIDLYYIQTNQIFYFDTDTDHALIMITINNDVVPSARPMMSDSKPFKHHSYRFGSQPNCHTKLTKLLKMCKRSCKIGEEEYDTFTIGKRNKKTTEVKPKGF